MYFVAGLSTRCYKEAILIFDLYRWGKIKGQKLSSKQSLLIKHEVPDCKQMNFKPLGNLSEEEQYNMLREVRMLNMSFSEMKMKAAAIQDMRNIQQAFCFVTATEWDEAQRRYFIFLCNNCMILDMAESNNYPIHKKIITLLAMQECYRCDIVIWHLVLCLNLVCEEMTLNW